LLRLISAVLLLACLPLQAQEQGTSGEGRASIPGPVSGVTPPLTLAGETPQTNVLVGSIRVSSFYDDNALNRNANKLDDFQYAISPSIAFQQVRRRLSWNVNYDGGVSVNQRLKGRDLVNHNAGAGFQYRLTRRATLQLRENYSVTSDPFDRIGQSRFLAGLGGIGQLNPFVVTPTATRISSVSKTDFTYQTGRHSLLGMSGSFSSLRQKDVPGAASLANRLLDTRSLNGRAYYAHQVSRRHNMGVEYDVQDLRFNGSSGRTVSTGVFYFDDIILTPRMQFSFFAGPQRSHTHDNVLLNFFGLPLVAAVLRDQWSFAGGGNFTWQGRRTALRLGAQRIVSDGGGLIGAVRLQSLTAEIRKNLSRRWSVYLEGSFFDGRSLLSGPALRLKTEAASLSLERPVAANLLLHLRYSRLHQAQSGAGSVQLPADHNRAEIGFVYEFSRPWGHSH